MTDMRGLEQSSLCTLTATDLVRRLAARDITPEALLEACLSRIALREPQVCAWAWHDPEAARHQLRGLPVDGAGLPLFGLPVGVKDIIDTRDMPTQYGSRAYAANRPIRDAVVVSRLKAAGAIVMGKTVTTEFAHVHAGPTVNPHNAAHTPGGSSSGSAAAVADFMVPLALGTQTGGSTIRPAAFCGIVGFKPTYGDIALDGVLPLAHTMDTMGIHARTVADVMLLYPILSGRLVPRPAAPGRLRIVWHPGPHADEADDDARQALLAAREILTEGGVEFVDVELPHGDLAAMSRANRLIMAYEASRQHRALFQATPELLGAATCTLIETGLGIDPAQYEQELEGVARCRRVFEQAMQGVDALMTFSAPGQAPVREAGTGASTFNRIWTTIGAPCLTIPAGRGAMDLPVGVQFVSGCGRDQHLLELGLRVEAMLGSMNKRRPV